jgi:hypothetical protein
MPAKTKKTPNAAPAAVHLLSRVKHKITLEVEVPTTQHSAVATLYGSWTGKKTKWSALNAAGHAHDMKAGKWGAEYRVYFEEDEFTKHQLERYGFVVDSGSTWIPNSHRVNSQALFKELVQGHGLKLGENS